MNKLHNELTPPIVVATHSPRWTSQIQRGIETLAGSPQAHWQLDIKSACAIAIDNRKAVLVVECPESFAENPELLLESILGFCNNAQNSPLFLLGNQTIEPWRHVLREAGATDVCSSILDFENMWQRVAHHLKISTTDDLTVEQTVAARLPW